MKNNLMSFVAFTTFVSQIICAFPLSASAQDKINGLTYDCKPDPTSPEDWKIEKKFRFADQGKNYELVLSRTFDGTSSLCLVQGKSGKPIGLKYWQSEFIDRVDRTSSKVFTFQVHEGNGNPTPTKKYRLNLTSPQKPQITLLKAWIVP